MAKATGIGGVFFKYKDENAMKKWFETALGLKPNDYGVLFSFNTAGNSEGYLQLGAFEASTDYFGKESQQAMINFRVDDMEGMEKHLRSLGTTICNEMETYEYGKFLHIEDPEGNRIELWEPVDRAFEGGTSVEMR